MSVFGGQDVLDCFNLIGVKRLSAGYFIHLVCQVLFITAPFDDIVNNL
jgi:hypothetical protein